MWGRIVVVSPPPYDLFDRRTHILHHGLFGVTYLGWCRLKSDLMQMVTDFEREYDTDLATIVVYQD